jgi:hypothetical protein
LVQGRREFSHADDKTTDTCPLINGLLFIFIFKGSEQRENRLVWSSITKRYLVWGVVMGVLLSFDEAAILYTDFNSAPSQKQNIIVFAANNSMCCECHVALTILLLHAVSAD